MHPMMKNGPRQSGDAAVGGMSGALRAGCCEDEEGMRRNVDGLPC